MSLIIYARLSFMRFYIFSVACLVAFGLAGCQSLSSAETVDIDSDVCVGEPVVVDDPDSSVDLEEMARQADCP